MSVTSAIVEALAAIEAEHDVRVLYAAESGSRAWGFASPDSDYDVRFIYAHRPEWYLRIDEPRDVIDAMLPGDLDLSGWDLRKTLRLFQGCNLALNEWLGSPIIYRERGNLAERLLEAMPAAFRAAKAHHHYQRLAQGKWEEQLMSEDVRLKDVFYALRALLACRWISATGTQPPTAFDALIEAPGVTYDERGMIARLRVSKQVSVESQKQTLAADIRDWLAQELDMAQRAAATLRTEATIETDALNVLFRETLNQAW